MPAIIVALILLLQSAVAWAESAGEEPSLTIRVSPGLIEVRGTISSDAHGEILRETVDRHALADTATFDLDTRANPPPGWALTTDTVLRAVTTARRASADVTATQVLIRGVTAEPADWTSAIGRVEAALLDGMQLDVDMITISDGHTFTGLCRRQFHELTRENRIEFFHSGATLRSGAHMTLDAIAELAIDCPDLRWRITGHTDASGDPAANVALSQARAEAVLAYLAELGVARARMEAVGAGSSSPLTSGSSVSARQRNRRVEFELL